MKQPHYCQPPWDREIMRMPRRRHSEIQKKNEGCGFMNGEKEDSGVWKIPERLKFRNVKLWKRKVETFMKFPHSFLRAVLKMKKGWIIFSSE